MKLVLSTSNIMTSHPSISHRPLTEKSNTELTGSLRNNITSAQEAAKSSSQTTKSASPKAPWIAETTSTLSIPCPSLSRSGPLQEPRSAYDITVKLFFLPSIPSSRRCEHTREALDLVLKELGVDSIDLLITSFPGISFDAEDDSDSDLSDLSQPSSPTHNTFDSVSAGVDGCGDSVVQPESIDSLLTTYATLESLVDSGLIHTLGLAEFGTSRLQKFLPKTRIPPTVDQINVRDCCVVPRPLIQYAKAQGLELLTHNDCTDILPRGTLRDLLGPKEGKGVGVLAGTGEKEDGELGLRGDVEPQFVVKYTAVVRDRGVVENKGYFAVAELNEE
ncbi:putative gamma-cysteine synthetase regulatory subunit [Aulographum hederae CBS 113979]|uniref:GCS light chain n=1 Tax=Aulographum hederae CBS 113979 TaxID=1176131 RepID=A0A6G1GQE6_9PEZI|nr:putative gamma-cysteine synthetase regulatory subunit [Aulographum hederae CBS 113979]